MKYFAYIQDLKLKDIVRIYNVVNSLTMYAKRIYSGLWEEALNKSFLHILHNYDENKGDLENYAIRIVKTIELNKYRYESENDTALNLTLDKISYDAYNELDTMEFEEEQELSTDVQECVRVLVPKFIKDQKVFNLLKPEKAKVDLKELRNTFSDEVILKALSILSNNFTEEVEYLKNLSLQKHLYKLDMNRWEKERDEFVSYAEEYNGILAWRGSPKSSRMFYRLNVRELIDNVVNHFHGKDGLAHRVIGGVDVYMSLSGFITFDYESIREQVEREIINYIAAMVREIKFIRYEKGEYAWVSSVHKITYAIEIKAFGEVIKVHLKKMVSKKIK